MSAVHLYEAQKTVFRACPYEMGCSNSDLYSSLSLPCYGTCTVNCPGRMTLIIPPHAHMHFEESFSAGNPPIRTVGEPGTHGTVMLGMQGIGVSTPIAAAVAAATVGLARELHMPNGSMFTIGLLSMIFASGMQVDVNAVLDGSTINVDGADPKAH